MAAFARARNSKNSDYTLKAIIEDNRISEAGKLFAFSVLSAKGDLRRMPIYLKLAGLRPDLIPSAREELEVHGYLVCETRNGEIVSYSLKKKEAK